MRTETKLKILIVDDEELNRELFTDLFEDDDQVEVVSCPDGMQALSALKEFNPDVVLLDIMMPGMDGYEVCAKLRENSTDKSPKIIMLTGLVGQEVEDRSRECGADRVYFKPINISSLHEEVMSLLI